MAGINFDTANTGYGGNYGGNGYGTNILDLAALGLVFGDGFGHRGYDSKSCCAPATCEQVNDVDRDVIRCSNDVDRDVLKGNFDVQRDIWTTDRDVLLTCKDIKEDICHSTHKVEKDIWDVDKDVLIGFKDTDHKIDMVKCEMKEGFAVTQGLIKETALCAELREKDAENRALSRRLDDARELNLKKDIVAEILAAMGAIPVIANR